MKYFKDNKTGSYYSLRNGELLQHAQKEDGSLDKDTVGAVDWDFLLYEPPIISDTGKEIDLYKHLKRIEKKLGA